MFNQSLIFIEPIRKIIKILTKFIFIIDHTVICDYMVAFMITNYIQTRKIRGQQTSIETSRKLGDDVAEDLQEPFLRYLKNTENKVSQCVSPKLHFPKNRLLSGQFH